jgi:chorismate mutase
MQMSIEDWRAEIDAIDDELLRLLNTRARLALKLGASKRSAGLALCDRARERAVVARVCQVNAGPLDERAVALIFRRIIRESRRMQARAYEQTDAQAEGVLP